MPKFDYNLLALLMLQYIDGAQTRVCMCEIKWAVLLDPVLDYKSQPNDRLHSPTTLHATAPSVEAYPAEL